MDNKELICRLWQDIGQQNYDNLPSYFHPEAVINWYNSNERFTVAEFTQANDNYPGDWTVTMERMVAADNLVITAVETRLTYSEIAFRVVSFFELEDGKITKLDEYWGDVGAPPQWRIDRGIGQPMK